MRACSTSLDVTIYFANGDADVILEEVEEVISAREKILLSTRQSEQPISVNAVISCLESEQNDVRQYKSREGTELWSRVNFMGA